MMLRGVLPRGDLFANGRGRRRCVSLRRRFRRDLWLTLFGRDDRTGCIGASAGGGSGDGFGVRQGNGPQQKPGEMTEGGGLLARNAPLREQAKNLSESAVHAGGGGEIAAGGIEFGKVERRSDNVASGRGAAEQLFLSFGVKGTHGGMNVRAGHGALASIGKGELTAGRQGFRRDASPPMDLAGRSAGREIAGDDAGGIVTRGWRDAVAVGCFLYGSHGQCYRQSKLRGQYGYYVDNWEACGKRQLYVRSERDCAVELGLRAGARRLLSFLIARMLE